MSRVSGEMRPSTPEQSQRVMFGLTGQTDLKGQNFRLLSQYSGISYLANVQFHDAGRYRG